MICVSFNVDESSNLPIISRWGNLADNPGGKLAWFAFFFFWVVSFGKDCAVLTGKSPDADVDANNNVKHDADAVDNNSGNNKADDDDEDNSSNNNEKDSDNDDNCCFNSNNAFFLPFLASFVGVTIEIDGLHLLERLSSDRV